MREESPSGAGDVPAGLQGTPAQGVFGFRGAEYDASVLLPQRGFAQVRQVLFGVNFWSLLLDMLLFLAVFGANERKYAGLSGHTCF